jgi:hypothetical protein
MRVWGEFPALLADMGERIRPRVGRSFSLELGKPASSHAASSVWACRTGKRVERWRDWMGLA